MGAAEACKVSKCHRCGNAVPLPAHRMGHAATIGTWLPARRRWPPSDGLLDLPEDMGCVPRCHFSHRSKALPRRGSRKMGPGLGRVVRSRDDIAERFISKPKARGQIRPLCLADEHFRERSEPACSDGISRLPPWTDFQCSHGGRQGDRLLRLPLGQPSAGDQRQKHDRRSPGEQRLQPVCQSCTCGHGQRGGGLRQLR